MNDEIIQLIIINTLYLIIGNVIINNNSHAMFYS